MCEGKELFSVFYAVLYGSMLASSQSLQLFPWGFPAENGSKRKILIRRLLISITIFNLLPFTIFMFCYAYLLNDRIFYRLSWIVIFKIGILSLSVFIPYRCYHLLIVSFPNLLYSESDYKKLIKKRGIRESVPGQVLALSFYLTCLLIFNFDLFLFPISILLLFTFLFYVIDE